MFPFKSILTIDKESDTPVYVQVANAFAREIRNGILKPGTKLPGARSLADIIAVNRNTVAAVYDELYAQGYVELHPRKGAFISSRIPDITPKPIVKKTRALIAPLEAGFVFDSFTQLPLYTAPPKGMIEFNDGLPDERIAPIDELARAYRSLLKRPNRYQFGYSDVEGNPALRREVSDFLNANRGMHTTYENVFITRGSQMGIFIMSHLLLRRNDVVVVGETNYHAADVSFSYAGAKLMRLRVDERGLDVDQLEQYLKKTKIKAVYVTPHHHFPTTVTLSACRRMKLLSLAEKYAFAILEDDYDYDFHYKSSPILPLASADHKGMVVSIGSMSKNFSPALRIAYVVAPKDVIQALARIRFFIDRQGDYLLEQAMADLFKEGVIARHLKKALTTYRERRDVVSEALRKHLKEYVQFEVPDGGLAVWTTFKSGVPLAKVAALALKKGVIVNDGAKYNTAKSTANATRLGFASLNPAELEKGVNILADVVKTLRKV